MSQEENGGKVALADAIAALRSQIREAARRAESLPRKERFHIDEVEIELTVVAEGTVKGGAEVGWWIFKASGEVAAKEAVTHKLKLKLNVGDVLVASDEQTN